MKGTPKQQQALKYLTDDKTKEVAYGGAAGGGKSFLGCFWLIVMCLAYPRSRWFIGREELKRIRQSTLITFYKVAQMLGLKNGVHFHVNQNDNFIEFQNGSRIDLLDIRYLPSDPLFERFGSTEYTGGWIEEAGETHFGAYEILKTRTGRHLNKEYGIIGKILLTLNPKKNWLYSIFYKPFKNKTLPDRMKFIQAFVQDNPNLPEDYIDNLRNTRDKARKERLLFGNWEYDDDPSNLCDFDSITQIFENNHVAGLKRYITADVARMGSDKAIILVWVGWRVVEAITYEKSATTLIQDAINNLRNKYQIPPNNCIADEDGVGGGVVDNCRIKGFINNSRPLEMVHNGKSIPENYNNLQSQCCFYLADKINEGAIYIHAELTQEHKDEIIEELEQLKSYQVDKENKLRILPKEKIKDNIGRSPDWRDALMMRSWFDLNPYKGHYEIGSL